MKVNATIERKVTISRIETFYVQDFDVSSREDAEAELSEAYEDSYLEPEEYDETDKEIDFIDVSDIEFRTKQYASAVLVSYECDPEDKESFIEFAIDTVVGYENDSGTVTNVEVKNIEEVR